MAERVRASLVDIARDVHLAWTVAQALPEKETALRDRLRSHIAALADPAEEYARSLGGDEQQCVARDVQRALAAADDPESAPPGEYLMQLANHAKGLIGYAVTEGRTVRG
ncbi:hypothetical protein [Streptomyces sp. NPDC047315]|uniref:hypothetical protein n=1 Tax=Streptomyces sp. NPDC047315 TaxID=3155142 RepID=UPI0033D1BED4